MADDKLQVNASGELVVVDDGLAVADDGDPCGCCDFIQAKLCTDDSDVDLWFAYHSDDTSIDCAAGTHTALPYYFSKDGQHYYVLDTNTVSTTPGTLCTGELPEDHCPTPNCACGNCSDDTPDTMDVTISSVTMCPGHTTDGLEIVSGTINGTFTLIRSASWTGPGTYTLNQDFPCQWSLYRDDVLTMRNFGSPSTTCVGVFFLLEKLGNVFYLQVFYFPLTGGSCAAGNAMFFYGTLTSTATCIAGPYTITNANAVCDAASSFHGTFSPPPRVAATGGSASLTPGAPVTCECPEGDCCDDDLCVVLSGTSNDGSYTFTHSGGAGSCSWQATVGGVPAAIGCGGGGGGPTTWTCNGTFGNFFKFLAGTCPTGEYTSDGSPGTITVTQGACP